MSEEKKTNVSQFFWVGIKGMLIVAVITYTSYSIGMAIYKNYQINKKIDQLKSDITVLQTEVDELKNLLVYYQSDGFKELEARRRLGLRGKDEKVIIIPKVENTQGVDTKNEETKKNNTQPDDKTNMQKWWDFIFK